MSNSDVLIATISAASALIGAVIGAGATLLATRRQTERIVAHEIQQAHQAAVDNEKAARISLTRWAAVELLKVLSDLHRVLPHLGWTGRPTLGQPQEDREHELHGVLDRLTEAQIAAIPLMDERVQKRWTALRILANELHTARPVSGEHADRADWTLNKIGRARSDIQSYLDYVRRTVVAVIDSTELPADCDPPVLRRIDMSVWQAPDEPHYVNEDRQRD